MSEPIILCWSGGKDSTLALRSLQRAGRDVVSLLTTVTEDYDRISMHGVRRELLDAQAQSLGIPLSIVTVPPQSTNEIYCERMGGAFDRFRQGGIAQVAFGDIFLADLKAWREEFLARHGLRCLFPIWGRDTRALFDEFVSEGFHAVTSCIDPRRLDASFAGRELDRGFAAELPEGVDPCGENGEFHTFVYDGPNFSHPVEIERGECVERDGFLFCDWRLVNSPAGAASRPAIC